MELSRGGHVLGGALLVAGTAIGGGMLGLPVDTAAGGFFPSIVIFVLCWLFMAATGLLLMEAFLWKEKEINLVSMAKMTLGLPGLCIAWALYIFLFYTLMVAYVSGGGKLFEDLFEFIGKTDVSSALGPLFFVLVFAPFVVIGAKVVDSINKLLMVGLILSFLLFLFLGVDHIEFDLLERIDFRAAFLATPIVFASFAYQGLVPTLTQYLDRNPKRVRNAIVIGTSIVLVIYIAWQGLILGVIPYAELENARSIGQSAVYPLKNIIHFPWLYRVGKFFAFFAIVTSFLGVALGLLDFLADGLKIKKTVGGRLILAALIFLPPLAISLYDPDLFIIALRYAGGIGCALLLGLLPILMVWRGRYILKFKSQYALFGGRPLLLFLAILVIGELALMLVKIG